MKGKLYDHEWYEVPVRVERSGKKLIVPASQVCAGDKVWLFQLLGTLSYTVHDVIPDDDEGIMYIKINSIDAYPADAFLSE